MIKKSSRELNVLVLRDTDRVADAVQEALRTAPDAERAGLERAAALIAEAAARSDAELRGDWVRAHLTAAGHDGPADSVQAIKLLRQAEPTLSLYAAVRLAKDAAGSEQRPR
ncbi:hypothetical protein OKJ48_40430 [Streptomyces kunmingensis]|uniref:Uncharacterized protein n=1 Tax=Streptomyces kunmingensis TaxID=68225 RepID=A0ABU6CQY0_9ACTN|nr:hypothetical protein [Streptomyces kunmingensis]MEB3966452.1 hypothetical protein [Streptomyces kunmingensis]